jgi:hypothetical protein
MAFTKKIALHDKITVDGQDMSNAFDTFGFSSEHASVPASGFSVSGTDENLAGTTTQTLEGEAFLTSESYGILYYLHVNRTIFPLQWQPDGLVDSTRETYSGNVQLLTFTPAATRGEVYKMTCTFSAADATGIVASVT